MTRKIDYIKYCFQGAHYWHEDNNMTVPDAKADVKNKGITYVTANMFGHGPFSILYACENIPEELPSYLTRGKIDFDDLTNMYVRVLSKEQRSKIEEYIGENNE